MGNLCKEAAIGPIRLFDSIETIDIKEVVVCVSFSTPTVKSFLII